MFGPNVITVGILAISLKLRIINATRLMAMIGNARGRSLPQF